MNYKVIHQSVVSVSLLLVLAFLLISCGGAKVITDSEAKLNIKQKYNTPEQYYHQSIDYHTFSGKAAMYFDDQSQSHNFTTQLRMKKDSDIWSSILGMGVLEVARTLITPDSLKAIIRLGKKAYALSYEEGLELIQAKVDFPILQNLLIGNPLIENAVIQESKIRDSVMLIMVEKDKYVQQLTYNLSDGLLVLQKISNESLNFDCEIQYANYSAITGRQPFAFQRKVRINNKDKNILLEMTFSKAELNVPVDVKLSIPQNYSMEKLNVK